MKRIICNPLPLAYAYQDIEVGASERCVNREGADPSLVRYRGRYYMFVSMSGGFWHSGDLVDWEFHATPDLPIHDYAPDVREIDGALVFTASKGDEPCCFWRTTDPLGGAFEKIQGVFAFWDPNLFQDDDGRVYLYWGCSDVDPIYGVELDRRTFEPLGEPLALIEGRPALHGWERRFPTEPSGATQTEGRPFIEGAWMTKRGETYYLQYSAPGAELNTYADGYYTADVPLGPFAYVSHSPFSSNPGGFLPGAGHGSTVEDEFGNWWHVSTARISVNHMFERRVVIHPAGFDEDGVLYCNQNFGDRPVLVPSREFDPWTEAAVGWNLLSYGHAATASSAAPDHAADLAVDEDACTWWAAGSTKAEEWLQVDLGEGTTVNAVQVNLADHDVVSYKPRPGEEVLRGGGFFVRTIEPVDRPMQYMLQVSADGNSWDTEFDAGPDPRDSPHRLIVLDPPREVRHVRLIGGPGPWGSPLAISGLRVFGHRVGSLPSVARVTTVRIDERTVEVSWATAGADGANVRYGGASDKLYQSWLAHGSHRVVLTGLNAGEPCWVAVDTFNGSGISLGSPLEVRQPED